MKTNLVNVAASLHTWGVGSNIPGHKIRLGPMQGSYCKWDPWQLPAKEYVYPPTKRKDLETYLISACAREDRNKVTQSCLTLCNPMNCCLPGSSVHGIFQARILEGVAISFSRESSQPRYQTHSSWIACRLLTSWAMREVSPCHGWFKKPSKENKNKTNLENL